MKNKNLLYLLLTICLPLLYTALSSNSSGRAGQSTIGCNGGGCHANNNAATVLTIAGLPSGGYVGGTTYTLQATVTNAAYMQANARGGFNITCSQGTFTATTGVTLVSSTEIMHGGAKAMSSGSVSWSISWTAPTTGTGALNFNFAGNACNGDFGTNGDQPNIASITLSEASTSTGPTIVSATATNITDVAATIAASINANGASSGATVEYGTTTAYGSNAVLNPTPFSGTTATNVSASLTGLVMNTTYHYRIVAASPAGTTNGSDMTFRTGFPSATADIEANNIELYPNPINDKFEVKMDKEIVNATLTLFTLTGKKIALSAERTASNTLQVDASQIASGVYLLNMKLNGTSYNQKIVIQ